MKLLTNLVRFLLLLFFIECVHSNKFISVTLQKCYGTCNKKYCNASILCRPLNRTSKRMSMDFHIRPGLSFEAPMNIEVIAYKKFRTIYRPHMVKLKAELCAQLNYTDHPFFSRFMKFEFKGNMFDPCPLYGHRYIAPYVPKLANFPLIPAGEWKMDFIISRDVNDSNEFIASWSNFYEVKPTSAVEF